MKSQIITLALTTIMMITVATNCASNSGSKGLEVYLDAINPVGERHADTTEAVNRDTVRFQQRLPRATNLTQATILLDQYISTLELAVPKLRADLDDMQRIIAPPIALDFHNKMIETFQYDYAGISGLQGYYVGFKSTGLNDMTLLNHSNDQLLKGRTASNEAMTLLRSLATR